MDAEGTIESVRISWGLFFPMGRKQTARKIIKRPHLADVCKAGFHCDSGLFIFGLRFCCSESKSENFLMLCHKWELRFEDFLIVLVTIEPLLVLIEYVPYGDLLGYMRKSRGLNDTYFKDPDMKPQTNLTAEQLMKFAWQVADGMCYLSSKKVCFKCDLN